MRKFKTRAGFRPLRVGIAATVTAAAVVAGTATSAFGAVTSITPGWFSTVGGQTLTITGSGMTGDTAVFIPSSNATCGNKDVALALTGASAAVSFTANATSATLLTPALASGSWRLCTYLLSVGATAPVIDTFSPITVTAPLTATVSPASGPTTGGNSISLSETPTDPNLAFVQGATSVVFVAAATCPGLYAPGTNLAVLPANVLVITPGRLAVTVPAAVTSVAYASAWSVCAYNGVSASSPFIARANALYTVGASPTITSVTPATGSPQGGNTISIVGTNLGGATVTIGGATVTPTVASSTATNFVGVTSAHAVDGPLPVVVSIAGGGSATKAAAFTYTNGVVISPTTSPNTKTRTDIDVQGAGFAAMNFTTTAGLSPNDNNAHVYLVRGTYDPTKNGTTKNVGQTTECLRVLPISDTELVCSLYLNGVPLNASHSDITGTVSAAVLTATAGSFTLGDVGENVTGSASISAGTAIASITDSTHAVLTKVATTNITAPTPLTLAPNRLVTDGVLTSGSTTITSATAVFSSADVGRVISGIGILAGTTITAVTNATTATMSAPPTTTAIGVSTTITNNPGPVVPNGSYTLSVVSNGGLDVQPGGTMADPSYLKSIISSGSTFTVADY